MKMLGALVGRSLARHRATILGLAGVLAGFQLLIVQIGINLEREGLFSKIAAFMPPFVAQAFGGSIFSSFGTLVGFGFFHPVVMTALAVGAAYLASDSAAEVEEGLVDIVAARPVSRHMFVTRSVVVAGGVTFVIVLLMFGANRAGVAWMRPPEMPAPTAGRMLRLAANLLAVAWCFGAASVAVSALSRRRATAAGSVGLVAVLLYLLHFAAAAWPGAKRLDQLSPFHYYDGMPILMGMKDPARDIGVLLTITAACLVFAYAAYERRDL